MWTPDEIKIISKSANDFVFFTNNIFSASSKHFVGGQYIDDTCNFLSQNKNTIMVSARNHAKSYLFYSYFMWKMMFEGAGNHQEMHYFSFNADMAAYHISKIKNCILANPFFSEIIDSKSTAESVLKLSWDKHYFTTLVPHGLIQFKRGLHSDSVTFVDDPFQDPENELNLSTIYKINEVMRSNILDIPIGEGELKIAGTAQSNEDFYYDTNLTNRFAVKILPAIYKDEKTGEDRALWPQWMDLEELRKKEIERTPRVFSREYLCTPVLSTKSFFDKQILKDTVVDDNLVLLSPYKHRVTSNLVVGGYDLGKRQHPAHFCVFELKGDKLVMIHQKFMDNWNYSNGKSFTISNPTQLEYIKMCIENFGIQSIHYDNTRGELDALDEQGLLPRSMVPVTFSNKTKLSMATALDKIVSRKQIVFCNDDRFLNQLCAVNSDLQAIESKEGHGDCYDDKTEILTDSGWKFFNDLKYTDKVATLKEQKYLEYQTPEKIINEDYIGKMYKIATTQVDLVVTPRHKLFVNRFPSRKEVNYTLLFPNEIEGKKIKYKKDCIWEGTELK